MMTWWGRTQKKNLQSLACPLCDIHRALIKQQQLERFKAGCSILSCYTTKAVRGPITKINQSDRSIAGLIFSKYWTGQVLSRMIPRCVPFST